MNAAKKAKTKIDKPKYVVILVLQIALFVVLLLTAVSIVTQADPYFKWHYEAHDILEVTGIEMNDLMKVTDKLIDYMYDKEENLDIEVLVHGKMEEVFGERERLHMIDVKRLFIQGKLLRDVLACIVFVAIVYFIGRKKEMFILWSKTLLRFFLTSLAIVGITAGLLMIDFNYFFVKFHEILFDNDLWILNPRTDILLQMVPEIFFFQTALLILVVFVLFFLFVILGSRKIEKRLKSKNL